MRLPGHGGHKQDGEEARDGRTVALHAIEIGDGPRPIVFLHGLSRNHRTFLPLARALGPQWKSWLLDLRGHGASPRPGGRYLVTDYAGDVAGCMRSTLNRPAFVYGHSLGAMVGALVAATAPQLVAGLILEEPPCHTMGSRIAGTFWEYYFRAAHQIVNESNDPAKILEFLREVRVPSGEGTLLPLKLLRDDDSLRCSAEFLAEVDPGVFLPLADSTWLDGFDLATVCARIGCPVILLQGNPSGGGALTDEDADFIARNVPHCRTLGFREKGHLIHWPTPELVLPIFEQLEMTKWP